MIHHISIAAHNPLHVSQVMAELLQGQSVPFPGYFGSYVALAFDPQGTMIEVHPFGTALFPGDAANEASHLLPNPAASTYTANHTAISVPVSTAQIQSIAEREGWRMVHCRRGDNYFDVIEFPWFEQLAVLEHFRGFGLPSGLSRLQEWQAAVAQRESVRSIANPPEFYLEHYGRLAQMMFDRQ